VNLTKGVLRLRAISLPVLILVLVSVGCSLDTLLLPPTPTVDLPAALTALSPQSTLLPTPLQPQVDVAGVDPATQPTPAVFRLWLAPYLPKDLLSGFVAPIPLEIVSERQGADLVISAEAGSQASVIVLALAAPFPSLVDAVPFEDISRAWQGARSGVFRDALLYLSPQTESLLSAAWGTYQGNVVRVIPESELLATVWADAPAYTLLPFEDLRPEWKVLEVEGQSPVRKEFIAGGYPLAFPLTVSGRDEGAVGQMQTALAIFMPAAANRDPDKLTTVVLTGVTALTRATAYEMEQKGVLHPAGELGPMLQQADILHISNEVPFASDCPYPNPVNATLRFCSADKYLELLAYIGTDIVELTGDHFSDWGQEATLHTLDLYEAEGWPYYGGARTPDEAREPVKLEHNGNLIAFIGCNAKGGYYTPGERGLPGAILCHFDQVTGAISSLKEQGYVVIMTFQHHEVYQFRPIPELLEDFRLVADAGADIVSGSQAHQPHGMDFYQDSLLMYGLGNLFFDQLLVSENTTRAIVARHIIYNNRHISTELFPIYFADFSKPLYLQDEGADYLFSQLFDASDWGELQYPPE
jgi:poly-gamma-glutamate synthesis protein (capsule biosynthesis protein)